MTTKDRIELFQRHEDVNRWLTRVYDPNRSPEHRASMWNFLMQHTNPKLKQLLINTRTIDAQCAVFWSDPHHRN